MASHRRMVIVIDEHQANSSDRVRARQCKPWTICHNGKDGIDIVVLKAGGMPLHPTTAVVETDDNCAPDIYGNSHCKNRLRLANGHKIEVQHIHNMQIDPCLDPGEVVEIEPEHPAIALAH